MDLNAVGWEQSWLQIIKYRKCFEYNVSVLKKMNTFEGRHYRFAF